MTDAIQGLDRTPVPNSPDNISKQPLGRPLLNREQLKQIAKPVIDKLKRLGSRNAMRELAAGNIRTDTTAPIANVNVADPEQNESVHQATAELTKTDEDNNKEGDQKTNDDPAQTPKTSAQEDSNDSKAEEPAESAEMNDSAEQEGPEKTTSIRSDSKEKKPFPIPHYKIKPVGSAEEVAEKIASQVSEDKKAATDEELQLAKERLVNRPKLGEARLRDVIVGLPKDSTFAWINLDQVVIISSDTPEGWAHEIDARKGRIVEMAKNLIQNGSDPQVVEEIFHADKPNERIRATIIPGPAGPMIDINDGTHRISACMVAGLKEIPVEANVLTYPMEQISNSPAELADWQEKIDRGLIDGEIQDHTYPNGTSGKKLVVKSEVVPWIRTTNQADLNKISRVYERMYPGSLDNLAMPRDALVDPIANNYFMAGRFAEWEALPKQPAPFSIIT